MPAMYLFDHTFPTSIENLAIDEALLDELELAVRQHSESGKNDSRCECRETLRLWEPTQNMVVIGRSSRINVEVDRDFCAENGIDVLRRNSGGASIVTGPGCLMYGVVLDLERRPELRSLDVAHCFVLKKIRAAINASGGEVEIQGTSDLTVGDRKFSGNALRITRNAVLYHGTLLNSFDLNLVSRCLKTPPRQPDYRQRRSHAEFLLNLELDTQRLKSNLVKEWDAGSRLADWPEALMQKLLAEKYAQQEWHERLL